MNQFSLFDVDASVSSHSCHGVMLYNLTRRGGGSNPGQEADGASLLSNTQPHPETSHDSQSGEAGALCSASP